MDISLFKIFFSKLKRQIIRIAFPLTLFSCNDGKSLNYKGFSIDSGIKSEVEKRITKQGSYAMGSMDVKMFENDSAVLDSYNGDRKLPLLVYATIANDAIHIIAIFGMFSGFGFYLDLYKDNSDLTCLVKSDVEIYKLHKEDSAYTFGLSVPSTGTKVILANKPAYKTGEVIAGKVELTSGEFYEDDNGTQKKCKMIITAFFKTQPVK